MASRSTVIFTCFLHGPTSVISTVCLSLPSSAVFSASGGAASGSGGVAVAVVSSSAMMAYSEVNEKSQEEVDRGVLGPDPVFSARGVNRERAMGLEPTTTTLATWHSTT